VPKPRAYSKIGQTQWPDSFESYQESTERYWKQCRASLRRNERCAFLEFEII
jgi:hypothetical protein